MSTGVLITSNNYSGYSATITFYPDIGGVENLGSYVIPVTLYLDYYYGTFELYFIDFNKTCFFVFENPNNLLLQENQFLIQQEDGFGIIIQD